MHEMSYIASMVDLAIEIAKENNAVKVKTIVIMIGKTSGVMPYYMNKYFPDATRGTVLEGAELVCEEVDVKAHCDECDKEYFPTREFNYLCPHCGGRKAHIIEGKGVTLKSIIFEE